MSEWRSSLKGMETDSYDPAASDILDLWSEWRSSLKGMETSERFACRHERDRESEWRSSLKGMETTSLAFVRCTEYSGSPNGGLP